MSRRWHRPESSPMVQNSPSLMKSAPGPNRIGGGDDTDRRDALALDPPIWPLHPHGGTSGVPMGQPVSQNSDGSVKTRSRRGRRPWPPCARVIRSGHHFAKAQCRPCSLPEGDCRFSPAGPSIRSPKRSGPTRGERNRLCFVKTARLRSSRVSLFRRRIEGRIHLSTISRGRKSEAPILVFVRPRRGPS
jgi:hypothetical protein